MNLAAHSASAMWRMGMFDYRIFRGRLGIPGGSLSEVLVSTVRRGDSDP
jgi:hypothetical protein